MSIFYQACTILHMLTPFQVNETQWPGNTDKLITGILILSNRTDSLPPLSMRFNNSKGIR